LIEDVRPERSEPARPDATAPIDRVRPNPDQPRKRFDPAELEALAESIRIKGVVQPLIVRPDPAHPGDWQIVAGERRWRAAQMAQVHEVPIVVRALDDVEVLEIGILENVQRADLNPIEEAAGYAQLVQRFGHTQERLAAAMGKSRSHIANALRLLSLPETVQQMAREGRLSAGHARALITAPNPVALAEIVVERGLSVRETERLAKEPQRAAGPAATPAPRKDADTRALEADLSAALGLRVAIQHRGEKGGELRIAYRDLEQLDGLCRLLAR
jgi:ParB family chromosome partitioning protein